MVSIKSSLHNDGTVSHGDAARQIPHHHRPSDNQINNSKVYVVNVSHDVGITSVLVYESFLYMALGPLGG